MPHPALDSGEGWDSAQSPVILTGDRSGRTSLPGTCFFSPMRYLYAVFVLSIVALICAAIGIARHIRRHHAHATVSTDASESVTESVSKTSLE